MKVEDVYGKMIGIFNSLQKQLYHQVERIEELEKIVLELRRKNDRTEQITR